MSKVVLTLYTIYDHPIDFPDHFVVRAYFIYSGNTEPVPDRFVKLYKDLESARERLRQMGLYRIPRDPSDKQAIVETWI